MVCEKCIGKLNAVAAPDKWKEGARNTVDSKKVKVNANKLLQGKQNRMDPYSEFKKCRICKSKVHQKHAHYCQGCAYRVGICAMCGKPVADTTFQRQTAA